jgi:carboxyl-terminal processing protease
MIVLMLASAALTYLLTYYWVRETLQANMDSTHALIQEIAVFNEARGIILDNFIGDTNSDAMNIEAVRAVIAQLGDPWSALLTPEEYQVYLSSIDYAAGIGLSFNYTAIRSRWLVTDVFADSPAEEAGIQAGDLILQINGVDVSIYELARAMIEGEENVPVTLTLFSAELREEYTVRLARRASAQGAVSAEILADGIGYIRIRSFESGTFTAFRSAAINMQDAGVGGLIIDVRENPGGQLSEMTQILDLIIPDGDLLVRRSRLTETTLRSDSVSWEIPMAVLVNRGTTCAAEYFAAVLQEYGQAVVLGAPTAGKGYEQTHVRLRDGSALWLSTSEYFTPQGRSLAGAPLRPDVMVSAEIRVSQVLGPRAIDETLQGAESQVLFAIEENRRLAAEEAERARG